MLKNETYGIWSVAVFAHNEAKRITKALDSIVRASEGRRVEITVLANGCKDRTSDVVREFAKKMSLENIHVVDISIGDKANAWNIYIQDIAKSQKHKTISMHVFIDGDVVIEPGSLAALDAALANNPEVNAVGAFPVSGRDKVAWKNRMESGGMLAGNLYALSVDFVAKLQARRIRIPLGFIGEDWLVTLYASSNLQPLIMYVDQHRRVIFAPDAGFAFRSLCVWRASDIRIYLRRLWRYALRSVQLEMLIHQLQYQNPETLPDDVKTIHMSYPLPSRLKWIGYLHLSLLRILVIQWIRICRSRSASVVPQNHR